MENVSPKQKTFMQVVLMTTFRRLSCFILIIVFYSAFDAKFLYSQIDTVQYYKIVNNSEVSFSIKSYCKQKKSVVQDVMLIAIREILFKGIPNTIYSRALFPEGEKIAYQKYEQYFTELIDNKRCLDFIDIKQISQFKKGGKDEKGKYTLFEIKANILQIRRDLEKNRIIKQLGF